MGIMFSVQLYLVIASVIPSLFVRFRFQIDKSGMWLAKEMNLNKGGKRLLSTIAEQCESLLGRFSASNSLSETKKLHAFILTSGLLPWSQLCSKLATTYARCYHASYASQLFDKLPHRSLFSWNTMMSMFVQMGRPHDTLHLFVEMLHSGQNLQPDNFTYSIVIKACADLSLFDMGIGVHGQTFKGGFDLDTFVQNSLLAMYMSVGEKEAAQLVFDLMRERTVVSWNALINGFLRNNCVEEALRVYNRMVDEGVEPDCATVVSVLPACGVLKNVELGREIHSLAWVKGFWRNLVVRNALLDMYVKCDQMKEAWLLVNGMDEKDVVTWTTLINGYILDGDARSALMLCRMMQWEGVKPNSITIASLLSACGTLVSLKHGKCLHAWAIRQRLDSEVIVETALIDVYAKCNNGDLSCKVFMKTSRKKTAHWNAVISGFILNGLERNAIQLFKQMLEENVQPDKATINSLLPAYAIFTDEIHLGAIVDIHCYVIKSGFLYNPEIASILMHIYSKALYEEDVHEIFDTFPPEEKDIILWNGKIAAIGQHEAHDFGEAVVWLFNEMVQSGVKPNKVTFTSVLDSCCKDGGLIEEGLSSIKLMLKQDRNSLQVDHYACLIALLSSGGRLTDAYDLIKTWCSS